MKKLFISATNTDIGKTYCGSILAKYLNSIGIKTLLCKPIETGLGYTSLEKLDCYHHLKQNQEICPELKLQDINFYLYKLPASPYVANISESIKIDFNLIKEKIDYLSSKCDFLIIEGAGGIMVPITSNYNMLDLALFLQSQLLIIIGDKLGMINDLNLNLYFLSQQNISVYYAINLKDLNHYNQISKPYINYLNSIGKNIFLFQTDLEKLAKKLIF